MTDLRTDLLIVTATEVETKAVFRAFHDITKQEPQPIPIGDKTYHNLGKSKNMQVCLVQSEMGTAGLGAAQQTVQKGIEALSPTAVIMVGIAFGVNAEKQAIGDILVSKQLMMYGPQRVGTQAGKRKVIPRGSRVDCSPWLLDRCRSAGFYWKEQTVHFGLMLSGEKLVDNLKFRQELLKLEPEAIGGEMEGAGLYVACQDKKVDWILVKAICDWGDGQKDQDKKERQELAARNAASFVLHVIQQGNMRREVQLERNLTTPQPLEHKSMAGPVLRLTQSTSKERHHRVEIRFENEPPIPVEFEFEITDQDYSRIRWYMEEFLKYPMDPAPKMALDVEKRIGAIGTELYEKIFNTRDAIKLWGRLQAVGLNNVRVEILTSVQDAVAIPWELLRDPDTDTPLALEAQSFVRAPVNPARLPKVPTSSADKVRILLVICRPGGGADVPFRSVAGKLVKGLDEKARERFELDVLRPPTFEQLAKTLREAKAAGQPYHIVHFDGHGTYLKVKDAKVAAGVLRGQMPLLMHGEEDGANGYLLFENPQDEQNIELVDGTSLGNVLNETDVPVLVLNACRSAHADIQERPDTNDDSHSQVRAFGSLAQEVMDAGVAGVVAMRYNVYVVTAAQFVADLYAALASGQTLGEAVSLGRKQLAAQPLREIAFEPRPLQDWSVPVVYEAAPIQLFPRVGARHVVPLRIDSTQKADDGLPRPEAGFFGRDETILALDRAFDTQQVVLLHAYAGSGKTMTAAEFARWYRDTGGLEGPILFTSFEQYKPLARVLDVIEPIFKPYLEQNNIQWLALSDEERLNITLQLFKKNPVLWIWDNVEPINGFPTGTASVWSEKEQRELKTFLQIITGQSKAKFLLTSRRDERMWLGDLPARVTLPPMPLQERVQLARALAEKLGKKMSAVDDWRPLLDFTQGNPMTLTVLVGQALRDGLKTKAQIYAYVNQLRNGEAAFEDETSEGRTKSLGASLAYGFEQAFDEDERKVLALLHFFQGFVDVDALVLMGNPKLDFSLPEIQCLTRDTSARDTLTRLLDKAAEIGLLTAHGGGYYTIHPALPWFFRSLFEQYYPAETAQPSGNPNQQSSISNQQSALRAFVEAMGALGSYYMQQYEGGNREVIAPLRAEEPNLIHARSLARQNGWWMALMETMQGLDTLYDHTGRRAEWKRLVDEIVPDFVGADDLPRPGREEQWSLVTEYCVLLAEEARDWSAAERLQRVRMDWNRRNAAALLARLPETLTDGEKNTLRSLAVSVSQLANILREQGKPECVEAYQEDYNISLRIGDEPGAAVTAFNLGRTYTDLPALRDLDEAKRWYKRDLELEDPRDHKGRAQALGQLGLIAKERFKDAKEAGKPQEELLKHLNTAADYYQQTLALLPPDAVDDLAVTHNQLGGIYFEIGDLERTLYHSNQCIHYFELGNNLFGAGTIRRNVALALKNAGRFTDALLYAGAALRNFELYGQGAAEDVAKTQRVIEIIEQAMKGQK